MVVRRQCAVARLPQDHVSLTCCCCGMMEEARQAGCIKGVGGKACSKHQDIVAVRTRACRAGTAHLLSKISLSTSNWHLAYDVGRQKSNMDAPAGCHKGHGKVLRHLTCSTCCCCGSSADEVKGYMQGHRGQGKQSDNHKCSKVQGLWAMRLPLVARHTYDPPAAAAAAVGICRKPGREP